MAKFNRSKIFKNAGEIKKLRDVRFRQALKLSFDRRRQIDTLKENKVQFVYRKVSTGKLRHAKGTMIPKYLPPVQGVTKNKGVVVYWDLEKNGWRSYRINNLQKISL